MRPQSCQIALNCSSTAVWGNGPKASVCHEGNQQTIRTRSGLRLDLRRFPLGFRIRYLTCRPTSGSTYKPYRKSAAMTDIVDSQEAKRDDVSDPGS